MAIGAIALALTFAIPMVYVAFDRAVGVANLARLMMHVGAMAFSIGVQRLLLSWVYPPDQARRRGRRWLWVYLPALVTQVLLFAGAPIGHEAVDFTVRYGDEPSIMAFLAILAICLTLTTADIVRLCWQLGAEAGRRYLRIGLRLTGIGAAAGLCYWVIDLVRELVRLATWPAGVILVPDGIQLTLFAVTAFVGTVFVAVGLTIPAGLAAGRRPVVAGPVPGLPPATSTVDGAVPGQPGDRAGRSGRPGRSMGGPGPRLPARPAGGRDPRRPPRAAPVPGRAGGGPGRGRRPAGRARPGSGGPGRGGRDHRGRPGQAPGPLPAESGPDDIAGGADLSSEAAWLGRVARALSAVR